jgi:phosphopantothenoylcysteine decarboxylase/phosphopantothenate--cysteine ligase
MCSLSNKRIIVGVTGGIAAYKSAEIIRRLQDRGADVRVVMTPGAEEFIRPLTMQALSGHPVHCGLLDEKAEAGMGHIELARCRQLISCHLSCNTRISGYCAGYEPRNVAAPCKFRQC